ncbi:MAG: hypothetical protein ACK504_11675, partial [Bacteroidota bacterium]
MKNLKFITKTTFILILCMVLSSQTKLFSQGETWTWHFGGGGANPGMQLKFPSLATSLSQIRSNEPAASISDAAGNLLFYTDGMTVWNQLHAVMPNGTGLFGSQSTTQGAMIIKQPGSATLYYIFTIAASGMPDGLR